MIKVVWKERKNTTTRGICKVESFIPTGFQFLAVGIQSELQQHQLFSPRCGGTSMPCFSAPNTSLGGLLWHTVFSANIYYIIQSLFWGCDLPLNSEPIIIY